MQARNVAELYSLFEENGIKTWLDGGWAVDALLEEQTRPHKDLDIVIQQKDVSKLRELLENKGYKDVPKDDTTVWNFVLGDSEGRLVDVHVIVFDEKGDGIYGPNEKREMFPKDSLTGVGMIDGITVRCLSPEWVVKFHTGYKLDENDFKDVHAICAKFGIELPEEYK